ncbi:MAG: zinc ABC transporter substrate-binding protein [Planctomycetes bacterium]|nr:zinc ABC transporter substrate-binding protein [Planctomycetota bacterium]
MNIFHPVFALLILTAWSTAAEAPLRICATVPDLGSLAQEIGGDRVTVTTFARGPEDPHTIEARPSFVRALADADLFIQTGLELEIGWAPVLLKQARNEKVLPGAVGYLEAASVIQPLEIPTGTVDRSLGDVHAGGNPHFFTDPLSGMKVAALIAGKLADLRPGDADYFRTRQQDFIKRIGAKMFGADLAAKYDPAKLALLVEKGALDGFLKNQGDDAKLAGWLGQLHAYAGMKVVADHAVWPYMSRTFSFDVAGYLEPKPGIPPTTRHLQEVITMMKSAGITVILTTPFFDPKHARVVAEKTSGHIANMAHQVGALAGTDDYISFVDHNVNALAAAFAGSR